MNKNTDHREDLEYIRSVFDKDEIKAPESLSEENILAMLPDREESVSQEHIPAASDVRQEVRARRPETRKFSARKWLAAAACFLIAAFGCVQLYESVTAPPDTSMRDGELYTFRSTSEIDHLVRSLDQSSGKYYDTGGDIDMMEESSTADEAASPSSGNASSGSDQLAGSEAKSSSAGGDAGHSETYLQVEEVDEADIVKTDGKYIYYVNGKREVVILEADNGKTHKLSVIGTADIENYIDDIYLKGDILITTGYFYDGDEGFTGIVTYDISDRSDPVMITAFRQTGRIVSSRMVGNYVYLVTADSVYKGGRILPKCTIDGEFREMDAESICCVPEPEQSSYIVLSAMDITSGKSAKSSSRAIFGATDEIYCNDHNLYAAVREWDSETGTDYTRIVRASLDGLKVKFNGSARVRGYIDNQFSMDEKDGYFRIATTAQRNGMDVNNLFVLDSKLKTVGELTGFARNESIRAVRYFGDKAYVITYEQIDPLFIIDLSDPSRPKIDGEVKIDGFSTLLIPAGKGRLLGIGHATGDNGYGGEYASGLKLALFDISDPSEPKVLDSKEFKDMDSPAQNTHKALTLNSKAGWYAIPYGIWHESEVPESSDIVETPPDADAEEPFSTDDTIDVPESTYEAGVLVFGADDKLDIMDQHKTGSEFITRSVYIGDYIYALDEDGNAASFRVAE